MRKIIKETADYVVIANNYGENDYETESKEQKLLCFGGEFDGQRKASIHFETGQRGIVFVEEGYLQFNRGEYQPKGTPNKAVYIHTSLLK